MRSILRSREKALGGMVLRVLILVGIASVLGACANPRGVMVPVTGTAPGTGKVDMLVATTRRRIDPQELFSGDRGPAEAFGNITVSLPPDAARQIGEVQWPRQVPGNPATDFVTVKADIIDRSEALAWFHRALRTVPRRQVLVFVHGFNSRFEDAVFRFAQIVHDSHAAVVPVLFTWPSRGSVLAYGYDRESTAYSRNAFEGMLTAISRDPAVGEISILAHSMGSSLALETLRQMAIRDGRVAPKIRNVLLAAPDVDVDLAVKPSSIWGREQSGLLSPYSSRRTTAPLRSRGGYGAARRGWARSTPSRNRTGHSSSKQTSQSSTLPSSRTVMPLITASSQRALRSSSSSGSAWRRGRQ